MMLSEIGSRFTLYATGLCFFFSLLPISNSALTLILINKGQLPRVRPQQRLDCHEGNLECYKLLTKWAKPASVGDLV